jgi:SAM-dependent methyltransferase
MSLKELSPTYHTRIREVVGLAAAIRRPGEEVQLLDAGCADGLLDRHLHLPGIRMVGMDVNEGDLAVARLRNPQAVYVLGSLEGIPFGGETYDGAVCVDVLEHLENDREAVRELHRVLRPGARLVVTVPQREFPLPYDPLNWLLMRFGTHLPFGMWGYGHLRLYSREGITRLLGEEGFTVEEVRHLSHHLIALGECSYAANLLQPLTKSDPSNRRGRSGGARLGERLRYEPPAWMCRIRDLLIRLDEALFRRSRRSVGILVVARKEGRGFPAPLPPSRHQG